EVAGPDHGRACGIELEGEGVGGRERVGDAGLIRSTECGLVCAGGGGETGVESGAGEERVAGGVHGDGGRDVGRISVGRIDEVGGADVGEVGEGGPGGIHFGDEGSRALGEKGAGGGGQVVGVGVAGQVGFTGRVHRAGDAGGGAPARVATAARAAIDGGTGKDRRIDNVRAIGGEFGQERAYGDRDGIERDMSSGQARGDGEGGQPGGAGHVDAAGGVYGQRVNGVGEVGGVEQLAAIGAEFDDEAVAGGGLKRVVQGKIRGGCGAGYIDVAGGVDGDGGGSVVALAAEDGEEDDLARGVEFHDERFGQGAGGAAAGEVGVAGGIGGDAGDVVIVDIADV